jgi:uncharacterized phage protein gp47/JayE
MAIALKTYNEVLGKMIRKMIVDSPANDINQASVLLTLLEAAATSDFDNNAAILSVLETLNIDALKNVDLDTRAKDYGLSRTTATKSTGFVTIGDSSITKRATTLYSVKLAPIAGNNIIYVNNASNWQPTGSLYIGRGTQQFEGPIGYTSIVNNGVFYTITLSSSLQKDHLLSDSVIDSQGKSDQVISAGTTVIIPANNRSPEIRYFTVRDAILAAGESSISNIPIIANIAGSRSNAGISTIVQFSGSPFPTATVTNNYALVDGRDTESDEALKERIKTYTSTLARGTREAILAAVIGVSDSTDGKQVASAVVTEPASISEPSILYVDDGTGFQPSYEGQPVDALLSSAVGDETFLQLANYPLPRPQSINQTDGPIELADMSILRVLVDDVEETITFQSSQFKNITAATFPEIISVINDNSVLFKARLTNQSTRILIYPTNYKAEVIQVSPIKSTDNALLFANNSLKFPTSKYSYIFLYRNGELLSEKQKSATLQTTPKSTWTITSTGNLVMEVDGTPPQDRTFTSADFSVPFSSLTLQDWVDAINKKFAGITAIAMSSDSIQISSNKNGAAAKLLVTGGTYFATMFAGMSTESAGADSQFALNRQTGNIQLNISLKAGDVITAGIDDAKGFLLSSATSTGSYNLATDGQGRSAELILALDGKDVSPRNVTLTAGSTITISTPATDIMRIMSNMQNAFADIQIDDYIYLVKRTSWLNTNNTGLFRVKAKGEHLTAGTDTYLDVCNISAIAEGPLAILSNIDVQFFTSDTYPQIWYGTDLPTPALATIQEINSSINSKLKNVKSSTYKTNSIKITSTSEKDGAISTPISIGNMTLLFPTASTNQLGNRSHIASKQTSQDLFGWLRTTPIVGTFLNRTVYGDLSGMLSTSVSPNNITYGEILNASNFVYANIDDSVFTYTGDNRSQIKPIMELVGTNQD